MKKGLEDNDYHVVEQDNFPPDYRQLVAKLRERIKSCDAVIHIAGRCYGAEPHQRPDGAPRRSYTQMEYDLAVELGKPVYVFLTGDGFPADPHEPEDEERTRLQAEHRQRLIGTGQDYSRAATREELDQKIRSLQLKIETLQEELTHVDAHVAATGRRLSQRFTIGAAVVVVLVGGIGWSISQLRREVPEKIKDALQDAVKELTNPVVLAARIRKEIHATVEEKIKTLPDEKGRGRLITEIERERDLALGRVDDLIKLIQDRLKDGASPVFQRATEILEKEGTNAAIEYLQSHRPTTLEELRRDETAHFQAEADYKTRRNNRLQDFVMEAELLEARLRWKPALELRELVAELAPEWSEARAALDNLHHTLADFPEAKLHLEAALKRCSTPAEEVAVSNDLARLLHAMNHLAEAEPLMRRALAIAEQGDPADHMTVSSLLNNLAQLLQEMNELREAEPLMRRASAIDEQSCGSDHQNVASDLNNLAMLLKETNRLVAAEILMRRALAIDEKFYGTDHPSVAIDLHNLAKLFLATNRLLEAESLMRHGFMIEENVRGVDHPFVAIYLNSFATFLKARNHLPEAEALLLRALDIDEESYGPAHPVVATDHNDLAALLLGTEYRAQAEPLLRRTLSIDKKSFGSMHPDFSRDLNNPANLLKVTNRWAEAEPLMRWTLAIAEQSHGVDSPEVAVRLNNLARLLHATNRPTEAELLMRRSVEILQQFSRETGSEHQNMHVVLDDYRELLQKLDLPSDEIEPRVQKATTNVEILKPITPEVDRMLGPAKLVDEVLADLDRNYIKDGKSAIYFLPLDQPIAPQLDHLFGHSEIDTSRNKRVRSGQCVQLST